MIRRLLWWGLILVFGVLVYNRFFGDTAEKEQSKRVFGEAKVLFRSVRDVVKNERQKFEAGKYDKAVSNIRNLFGKMRESAKDSKDILAQIEDLDKKRQDIETRLNKIKGMPDDVPANYDKLTEKGGSKSKTLAKPKVENPKQATKAQEEQKLQEEMDKLMNEMDDLMNEMEKRQQ
jgi:predicted  nucleic acid-binding Zn-ribbon protein